MLCIIKRNNPSSFCKKTGSICYLKDFDKNIFSTLVMQDFSLNAESLLMYDTWYNTIVKSAVKAGAVIYDGWGKIKKNIGIIKSYLTI